MTERPREPFAPGTRIELVQMGEDPDPIPAGSTGTVVRSTFLGTNPATGEDHWQVTVTWDSGRGLMVSLPHDDVRVLGADEEE